MKILYGIQGTGNGHLTRARLMAAALHRKHIAVDFFFSGRQPNQFFDMQCFGNYQVQPGLTFATRNGEVQLLNTALQNSLVRTLKDVHDLDLAGYDLVLNDYEPLSAWAAKRQGIPSVGISHQAALKYDVPKIGNHWFNEVLLNYFAPTDISLGCHWHHFGFEILPPFVDTAEPRAHLDNAILVYLPFENPVAIVSLLAQMPTQKFWVYHGIQPQHIPDNVTWFGFSREGFKQHLAQCDGVISSAGFELISEALTLGKKLLIKPVLGQFEQLSNLAALQLLGAADGMSHLDLQAVKRWLKSPSPEPIAYPQVGDALVDWLLVGDWHNRQQLCQSLWQQVDLPATWRKK
ncbi:MJ1255/VC2487 family glycosyltransferase [Shewanella gelidii]|uniref:Glycosyl transferase n=1 Tax=Shewanella gelidii TaxID=1642821 RepID=A0A917JUN9_9GAMM|nr:MJ1255/VC2487 family glycosyltransferase [Shewanella gelidii]MCL1098741.1 glycosyltransferase [Shewanella gelidii]GGI87977.1 glycosyl transferase [Shewanella gelidii]